MKQGIFVAQRILLKNTNLATYKEFYLGNDFSNNIKYISNSENVSGSVRTESLLIQALDEQSPNNCLYI